MALDKATLDAYIQALYDDDGQLSSDDYQLIINFILSNGEPATDPRDLLQFRRGNVADLPTLAQGEPAFTLDEESFYVGGIGGNVKISNIFDVDGKKNIAVVAGAIRQDATDRTKWYFINDANHDPLNVLGDFATASGSSITIPYAEAYSKVLGFVVAPDETFANAYQMTVGASVGLSTAVIKASARIDGAARIYYDGANWQLLEATGAIIVGNPANISFSGGNLTITHDMVKGINTQLTPYGQGANPGPYTPVIKATSETSIIINFYDESNQLVTVADNRMAFWFTRSFNDGISLDGTNGWDGYPFENGNLWFIGLFEK